MGNRIKKTTEFPQKNEFIVTEARKTQVFLTF